MTSENPKGPLGQPLTFGELVSHTARQEDVRQTTSFLMDQTLAYVRKTFPNATVLVHQDVEYFAWAVKIEIQAEDKWGKRQRLGVSQLIRDEEMEKFHRAYSATAWTHFMETFVHQMVKSLERELERNSYEYVRGTQDRMRAHVKRFATDRDAWDQFSRAAIGTSESLDGFKEAIQKVQYWERQVLDNEVQRAIESIKKRADLD